MSEHHFNDNAYGISLPPISLPLFTSEPLPHANKKSIQDRRKKVRLPSFKELSGMVESRQEKAVVPLTQQTKNFNPTANNSSWTRSIRPKQLMKKGILHHKKKPSIIQNKCHSCNSTETPEWRKGPLGPRTLCNACGLIWTKLCKQYETESGPEHQDNSSRDKHHLSFLLT